MSVGSDMGTESLAISLDACELMRERWTYVSLVKGKVSLRSLHFALISK